MPTKQTLIIVHGMGDPKDFKQDVIASVNSGLDLYPAHKGKKIEQLVDIVYFDYNTFLDKYRKAMADDRKKFRSRLNVLEGADLKPIIGDFLTWEHDIDADSFFKTHLLDVLFYRYTFLAEYIRIGLADEIVKAVDVKGSQNVHVLGHSLGTSVVHDTLESLYKPYPDSHPRKKNLDPGLHRLGSVHLVANVSCVLQTFKAVEESLVRPCNGGCTHAYYQYRHAVDPFTWPSPFDPIPNTHWTASCIGDEAQYRALRPTAVTDWNTHALTHYLKDPQCHGPLLQMLSLELTNDDIKNAARVYEANALAGRAQALRDKWRKLDLDKLTDVPAFIKAARELRDFLANFGQTFKE